LSFQGIDQIHRTFPLSTLNSITAKADYTMLLPMEQPAISRWV
jgi:hypothetical protein